MSGNYCLFLEGVCVCEFLPKPLDGKFENWTMTRGTSRPDVFFLRVGWETMKLGSGQSFGNWAAGFPHMLLFKTE